MIEGLIGLGCGLLMGTLFAAYRYQRIIDRLKYDNHFMESLRKGRSGVAVIKRILRWLWPFKKKSIYRYETLDNPIPQGTIIFGECVGFDEEGRAIIKVKL